MRASAAFSVTLTMVFALQSPAISGDSLEVTADRCGEIRVRAENVPVTEVLEAMSEAAGFRLVSGVSLEAPVSLDRTTTLEILLEELLEGLSTTTIRRDRAQCENGPVIASLWIHPEGDANASLDQQAEEEQRSRIDAPLERNPEGLDRNQPPRGTRGRMSDEEWQRTKEAYAAGEISGDSQPDELRHEEDNRR